MLTLLLCYAALCDPHFDRREAATARLAHLIDRHPAIYGPRLGDWCRGATCPEVRSRAMRVLGGYVRWRAASYVPRGVPVWPICDAYPVACPVIPFGLEDVRDRCYWPVEHRPDASRGPAWTSYRATTWEAADDLVRRMWLLEARDRSDCGVVIQSAAWAGGYLP